ncbi:MAG: hypothetical protein JNN27_24190 [Planctomycetes bacterium]|nr:hypothetical protein [Planctomycetota bacterium]
MKWRPKAPTGLVGSGFEGGEARRFGGAGVFDTTEPTRWRGSRARSVLAGVRDARLRRSRAVRVSARPWRLGQVAEMREDLAHDDWVCELRDEAAWATAVRTREDVDADDGPQSEPLDAVRAKLRAPRREQRRLESLATQQRAGLAVTLLASASASMRALHSALN